MGEVCCNVSLEEGERWKGPGRWVDLGMVLAEGIAGDVGLASSFTECERS